MLYLNFLFFLAKTYKNGMVYKKDQQSLYTIPFLITFKKKISCLSLFLNHNSVVERFHLKFQHFQKTRRLQIAFLLL